MPRQKFINKVKKELDINLRVTIGYRSFDEQDKLYNQGKRAKGQVVTNAKVDENYHNYGIARDVVEIKNGKTNWDADRYG